MSVRVGYKDLSRGSLFGIIGKITNCDLEGRIFVTHLYTNISFYYATYLGVKAILVSRAPYLSKHLRHHLQLMNDGESQTKFQVLIN